MSRSVSTHPDSIMTVYLNRLGPEPDGDFDDIRDLIRDKFTSFDDCQSWEYRECHIILYSSRAKVSVSEYNGIVAIDLIPREDGLSQAWCHKIAPGFQKLIHEAFKGSVMHPRGSASNGEQFFSLDSEPASVVTSKEGRLF